MKSIVNLKITKFQVFVVVTIMIILFSEQIFAQRFW